MKRKGIIFARIENLKKFKFPVFIKNILIASAFDTAAALKTIKKESIADIEQFVSNRLDLLTKTEYIDQTGNLKTDSFKFLPGHEALILNLPKDTDDYLQEQNKVKELPSIDNLKLSLVERINNFAQKNNLKIATDKTVITHSKNQVKCALKCSICSRNFSISFLQSSWKLSNFQKHILLCAEKNKRPQNILIQRATPTVTLLSFQNAVPTAKP